MYASAQFYYTVRLPFLFVTNSGVIYSVSCKPNLYVQLCTHDGIKVKACSTAMQVMLIKCTESDNHSARYTSFMLDTINAMM